MTRRSIVTWSLFGVLCVVSVVLVIVGRATHEEPGFTNEANRWDHTPLTVSCSGYVPEEDESCSIARSALRAVNARLGFDMLEWTGVDYTTDTDIHVVMRAPVEVGGDSRDEPGGHFELRGRAGVYEECKLWTMNVSGQGDIEWLTIYHELGHCMGLAHDDYELSIMRPEQRETPSGVIPPWISDFDKSLLRERYNR